MVNRGYSRSFAAKCGHMCFVRTENPGSGPIVPFSGSGSIQFSIKMSNKTIIFTNLTKISFRFNVRMRFLRTYRGTFFLISRQQPWPNLPGGLIRNSRKESQLIESLILHLRRSRNIPDRSEVNGIVVHIFNRIKTSPKTIKIIRNHKLCNNQFIIALLKTFAQNGLKFSYVLCHKQSCPTTLLKQDCEFWPSWCQ